MINHINLTIYLSLIVSFKLLASNYPVEFSDFFENVEKEIEIELAGSEDTIFVTSIVNFDSIKLIGLSDSVDKLRGYLLENNIKPENVDIILNELNEGVSKNLCLDRDDVESCIEISIKSGNNYYDYDFDEQSLVIYVGAQQFNETFIRAFHEGNSGSYSLINSTNFYIDSTNDKLSMFLRDELTLGLPYGYFYVDSSVRKGLNGEATTAFDLETALYTLDIENKKLMLGQTVNNFSFNETDFFNYGLNSNVRFVALGSSTDLARGAKGKTKRVYFYSEKDSRIEVYKDQTMILTKIVKKGANYISYDELPRGIYTIEIVEKNNDDSVVLERKLITNTAKFSLGKGQYDYTVGISQAFKNSSYLDNYSLFGYGKFTYRLSESSIIGSSLSANDRNVYFQPGLKLAITDNSSMDYMLGLFDSGATYNIFSFNLYNFYAQVENYKSIGDDLDLSSYLYGDDSYASATLGLSGEIFKSRYYIQYDLNESDFDDIGKVGVVSSGINKSTPLGTFDLYGQFQRDDNVNDWRVSLTWTYELGSGFSNSLSHQYDSRARSLSETSLSYSHSDEDWNANLRLTGGVNDSYYVKNTATAFGAGQNRYVRSDIYASYDSERKHSVSMAMFNTQLLDKEGISFTSKRGDAFVRLSVEGADKQDQVAFSLKKDNRYAGREIISDEEKILSIQSYSDLDIYVDEGLNYQRSVKRYSEFMYPGSILTVKPVYSQVKSFVLILEDFFGNPIESAQCLGDGCVSIEPVTSDGVFRLNTNSQNDYRVVSKKRLCLLDRTNPEKYSRGICLPDKRSVLASLVEHDFESENLDKEDVFFVGVFESDTQYKRVIDSLSMVGINYEVKDIGESLFLFLTNNFELSMTQIETIKTIQSFVLNMEGQESLYSIKSILVGDNDA